MKISKPTLEVLKNFAQINANLMILPGNTITTMSVAKNIISRATVEEEFPVQVPIYDLNTLLQLLSMSEDGDVEFGNTSLTVSKEGGVFEYFYADPSVIETPPSKTPKFDAHYEFQLTSAEITTMTKAAAITGATHMSVVADGSKAFIVIGDPKTPSSNNYKKELGDTDLEFNAMLAISALKLLPDDYVVTLYAKKVLHLQGTNRNLQYWLALDPTSKI